MFLDTYLVLHTPSGLYRYRAITPIWFMILSRLTLPIVTSDRSSNNTIYAFLSPYSNWLTNPLTTYLSLSLTISPSLCHMIAFLSSSVGQNSSLTINLSGSMAMDSTSEPTILTAALFMLRTSPSSQNTTAGYSTIPRKSE